MTGTRVMHIGWGMLPFWGGGMVHYQKALAVTLSRLGWDVVFLVASRPTISRKLIVTPGRPWGAVRVFEILNAPDPHAARFFSPERQCADRSLIAKVLECVSHVKPDIIHLHDLRLYSASLIEALVAAQIPVVKTVHNYWDLCPQSDFRYRGTELCTGYEKGANCVRCISALPPPRLASWNARLEGTLYGWGLQIRRPAWAKRRKKTTGTQLPRTSATIAYTAEDYHFRRQFFVRQLNQLSGLICPSHGCAALFVEAGVHPEVVRVIPHSSEVLSGITPKPIRQSQLPVTFGYCGGPLAHKGFHILLEAFSWLDQSRARLLMYDCAQRPLPERYKSLNVSLMPRYRPEPAAINRAFAEIDVGVVPSQCYEVFGLIGVEFLQARIPVIGSDIGGIPEWLRHQVNGLLVPPQNAKALADAMQAFVDDPGLVSRLQRGIQRWKTFQEHAGEVALLYSELLRSRPRGPAAGNPASR